MKYADFASLVQLGVGLHLGTALLQLYGDIGMAPTLRSIARIKSLLEEKGEWPLATIEALRRINGDIEIFRIELYYDFKYYVIFNGCIAAFLASCLVLMAFYADASIPDWVAVLAAAISILPAPLSLAALWIAATGRLKSISERADCLEEALLSASHESPS